MIHRLMVALSVAILPLLSSPEAAAAVGEEEAARSISERFDVQVLRVRAGEIDGRAVWLVTVMQRGGTRNDAFQVTTLAVDRESGELVPAFRHRSSGYDLPGALSGDDKVGIRPDAARGRTWR